MFLLVLFSGAFDIVTDLGYLFEGAIYEGLFAGHYNNVFEESE